MYLRCNSRFKDGKQNRYWNILESKRLSDGKVIQRQVLYLGEINDSQKQAWCRVIEAFDEKSEEFQELALFSAEKELPEYAKDYGIQLRLEQMELCRPRQYGACWLACYLYEQLGLDGFWQERLTESRGGKSWRHILQTLVCYRLIDPGSEWRLHRQWYERSAMGDLLDEDQGVVEKNALYRCMDKVLEHKQALFSHLTDRWRDLFGASCEVLLYDLTSTYFESSPPGDENDKRRYGYSRDKRSDCVQVVLALIVTPEGFPLAYEVLPGNTSDRTTLREFLKKIETQYGKAQRIWVMDRGIPTEDVLSEMRQSDPPVYYLVGTPKGRLQKFEQDLLKVRWQQVRGGVEVKLLARDQEFYVLAKSHKRVNKERSIRQRQLKALVKRLTELREMKFSTSPALLLKLGAAKGKYPAAWRLMDISLPKDSSEKVSFSFRLNLPKLRAVRRREGHYLLRTNLGGRPPEQLWQLYIQLVEIEAAFKNLKDDLQLRPIYHQLPSRIEAHIFVAFMAYCLHVTLRARLRPLASGLTPRAVLDKLSSIQMLDVKFPITDGRTLVLTRHTEPDIDQKILLEQLKLSLPPQPPPRISASANMRC